MKKIIPIAAAAVIAAASYFIAGTPVADAIQIALDPAKATAACEKILKGE